MLYLNFFNLISYICLLFNKALKNIVNISEVFPKYLFWDMDYSKLSIKRDMEIIIPRALFASTELSFDKDIAILESFYTKEEILFHIKNTKERISNSVCIMVAKKYKVSPFYRYAV